jgi:subtilase family serine protease
LSNAASLGISVFNSTGDAGSKQKLTGIVGVNYPSSNANVVAVGGTILTLNTNNQRSTVLPEYAAKYSGGGISSIIELPVQQTGKTYQTYKTNGIVGPVTSLPRRGIPDIAAPYGPYAFYFGGTVSSDIGGTSASTPIMAGMMARFISLNGGRRPPPNSLAKILYSNSFFDIVRGNNAYPLQNGYLATVGWDPVTGLGSQANGVQTYQSVTSAGIKIKNNLGTWAPVKNISVKTGSSTWTAVNKVWTKTSSGWTQVF